MEKMQFEAQMQRLKDQWPNSYSNERMKLLWMAFKDVNYTDFQDAVSEILMSQRSAPLLDEISKAVQLSKNRYFDRQRARDASIIGMMNQAAEVNVTADPAFVSDCLNLLEQLLHKKITLKEFEMGCDLLTAAAKNFAKEKGYLKPEPQNPQTALVRYNPADS